MTDEAIFKEVLESWKLMSLLDTTLIQWRNLIKGLGFLLINEKLSNYARSMLEATL